jgi:transposase-like protein
VTSYKKQDKCMHTMLERTTDAPNLDSYETKMHNPERRLEPSFKCNDCGAYFFAIVSSKKS